MEISIIGTGYVGLTTGIALAELGNRIILVDVIPEKLRYIEMGKAPFFEPGVDEMLLKHVRSGNITTTPDTAEAVKNSTVTFISVGTPSRDDGSMDDTYIRSASEDIGKGLSTREGHHIVVVRSTVVPGTTVGPVKDILEHFSGRKVGGELGLAMCPEFLREGAALHDSMNPDRVVIGCIDEVTFDELNALFKPLGSRILRTTPTAAEMIKYASNSLLATKISFANELSRICEEVGVDVYEIMEGVGLDHRISPLFLRAGAGFGGSCFPKDVSALRTLGKKLGIETPILDGVLINNEIQPKHLVEIGSRISGGLRGKRVAVLGLAFKPDTDDIRETRSLPLVKELIRRGARITATDPRAMDNFRRIVPDIDYTDDPDGAVDGSEVVFLMTEWEEFKRIDWKEKSHLIALLDGRRVVDNTGIKNVKYWAIGCPLP